MIKKKIKIQNSIKFVNYSIIDHEFFNKIISNVGKITKSPSNLEWPFCSRLLKVEAISLGHNYSLPMVTHYNIH